MAAFALALLLAAAPAAAQAPPAAPAPTAPQIVRLAPPQRLVAKAYGLPQIATPATPATAKINAELKRQDRIWLKGRSDCLREGKNSYVERGARAVMLGPEFYAVEVRHDAYCDGAAHPNQFPDLLTYDLRTGAPVNWSRLIPRLRQHDPQKGAEWGDVSPTVTWPAAHRLYAAKAKAGGGQDKDWWAQCQAVVEQAEGDFLVHPDPEAGGLAIEPNWLSHVDQACGDQAVITPAELRRLGADARLANALETARRAHAYQREGR